MDPSHLPKRRRGGSTSARLLLALDPRDSFGNGNAPDCSDDGERKIVELGERKRSAAISILEKSGMLLEGDATLATQAMTAPSTPRGTYNLLSLSDFSIFNLPNGFTMSSGGAARWSHRPTGCKALNSLLYTPMTGEGLPAGHVIELFGNPGSGRTQVVMSCVAACAVSEIPVMVIDTCNGIQPSSIAAAIARALHNAFPEPTAQQKQAIREQYEPAMDRVGVERCFSLFTLLDVLAEILRRGGREAGAGGSQVGLLAIDCLHSVISPTLGSCFNPTSTSSTSSTSSFYSPLSPRELVNSVLLHLKAISALGVTVLFTNSRPPPSSTGRGGGGRGAATALPELFPDAMVDIVLELRCDFVGDSQQQGQGQKGRESVLCFTAAVVERPLPFRLRDSVAQVVDQQVKAVEDARLCFSAGGGSFVGANISRGGRGASLRVPAGAINPHTVSFTAADLCRVRMEGDFD
jgi:hypothetical protein